MALAAAAVSSAAGLCGCETARNLAPPGFFKYEDIAGDTPVNPEIAARIAAQREDDPARFPNLSRQPAKAPATPSAAEIAAERAAIAERGDALRAAIAEDKAAAAADPRDDAEGARDALAADVDALRRAVEDDKARAAAR
ncbi:MAG: hypothetical protein AAGC56_03940 [Pseudomonadota bacterium]